MTDTAAPSAADPPEPVSDVARDLAVKVGEPLRQAHQARASGDLALARDIVESTIRAGQWTHSQLWSELVSLMQTGDDYPQIRRLWLDTPTACHDQVPVLRAVARAASIGGAHADARVLLRKAILLRSRPVQRMRAKLRPLKRTVLALLPGNGRLPGGLSFASRAAIALADLDEQLSRLDVRTFLISGTLLGYVRESGFISWDKDIDLGFFTDEVAPATLEKAFVRSSSFVVRRLDFNTDRLRVNHTNGTMIDIFPHYRGDDGRVWHDGTATRWWNSPFDLTTVEFLGRKRLVPHPPERYLEENYGDWRTPQSDFDARLDTPNVEITDPDYFHTLLYFSLLDALERGNRRKRRRYAGLVESSGSGSSAIEPHHREKD